MDKIGSTVIYMGTQKINERTPTQSVRGIVRSAKELHSGLIPFISPHRGMFPTETGIKPSARIKIKELSLYGA